jgi:hypothetical protein
MRTTVELPPDLFRKVKARAAARGESLRALLTRLVAAELGQDNETRRRVELPLFGDPSGPPVDLNAARLARVLAGEDAALAGRRRRRSR